MNWNAAASAYDGLMISDGSWSINSYVITLEVPLGTEIYTDWDSEPACFLAICHGYCSLVQAFPN